MFSFLRHLSLSTWVSVFVRVYGLLPSEAHLQPPFELSLSGIKVKSCLDPSCLSSFALLPAFFLSDFIARDFFWFDKSDLLCREFLTAPFILPRLLFSESRFLGRLSPDLSLISSFLPLRRQFCVGHSLFSRWWFSPVSALLFIFRLPCPAPRLR